MERKKYWDELRNPIEKITDGNQVTVETRGYQVFVSEFIKILKKYSMLRLKRIHLGGTKNQLYKVTYTGTSLFMHNLFLPYKSI
jgi:hypothetical protein